jgi:hypothetical protein
MKKTVLFSILALTASVFADGDLVAAAQKMNNQSGSMNGNGNGNMNTSMITLASARPESDNGWYLFADALYWHADAGQADWAVKVPNNTAIPKKVEVSNFDFKWSWGFKAGIGANMDHDMWDTNFYYTWFYTENSKTAGVNAGLGTVRDNLGAFGEYTSGKMKWDIHYSMFDWEIGRWFYVSKNLALRPHGGLKGGWIDQDIHVNINDANAGSSGAATGLQKFRNDFWGVGPAFGLNTMWILGSAGNALDHRFSIFVDVAGALMYGHYNVKNEQNNYNSNGALVSGIHPKDLSRNLATTMLQTNMGLSWDTPFNRGRNHFMLKVGYELQYWFVQNQFARVANTSSQYSDRLSSDLSLQGVTGEFRFDF